MLAILCLALIAFAQAKPTNEFQEQIDLVNSLESTWVAGHNFGKYISMDYIKSLCGVLDNPNFNDKFPGMLCSDWITVFN